MIEPYIREQQGLITEGTRLSIEDNKLHKRITQIHTKDILKLHKKIC